MKEVSAATELPELDSFDERRECPTMGSGDDRVTISPKDGDRGEFGKFVSALEECATLATPINHVSHRSRERAR
ncbi:MAG TPA: hypothetical protein VK550_10505 [Polyangiaceae bacterium]|nr:hypothetical protein [Polyangiaceae bacterium]